MKHTLFFYKEAGPILLLSTQSFPTAKFYVMQPLTANTAWT